MVRGASLLLVPLVLAVACAPDLDQTVSIVTAPRILAVQGSPAEAAPKGKVTLTALVVDDSGPIAAEPARWAFCNARNALANLGPVNVECLEPASSELVPIGLGGSATGLLPDVACRQFGPEVPVPQMGQPAGRPVDPDTTGGYYQPVSIFAPAPGGDVVGVYRARLSCGVAGASATQSAEFTSRYRFNENPVVQSLSANGSALVDDTTGKTNAVVAGAKVSLEVAWPRCPTVDVCGDGVCGPDETATSCPKDCKGAAPAGCSGAERYVTFDLGSQSVVDAREGMHVSWFATAGSFDLDRTGRTSGDDATSSDDTWTAPSHAGAAHLWVVLHDDRGGVGWKGYALSVR